MKLNVQPKFGNSPKKELLKKLTVHFASYELEAVMEFLAEGVEWHLVGDAPIVGKYKFRAALETMKHNKARELTILNIVTHGKEAAVNGEMHMQDGSVFGFADFYHFASGRAPLVQKIVSYVVEIK